MSSSVNEEPGGRAIRVTVTRDALAVDLEDGRTLIAPLAWYPRLLHGTTAERKRWRIVGRGEGIHWPDLDEDISVAGLLAGKPSGESRLSVQQWVTRRTAEGVDKRGQPARKKSARG